MYLKKFCMLIALICLFGAIFTGCGENSAQSPNKTKNDVLTGGGSKIIYVITPSYSNPFFKTEADAASKKAIALGYEVKVVSHDDDVSKQAKLFDAAISDKAAAIICDNAGADATMAAIRKAREAKIPTFLIDREINASGVAISQIIANNRQGAMAIAEVFVEAMEEKGKYAELLGRESDINAEIRSSAFHEVIDQYSDMQLVSQEIANWQTNEAHQKTMAILKDYPDIKGIICGNDTMAVGAVEAVKSTGLDGEIIIVGLDGSDEATEAIKRDLMVGTALQQAALIAEMAVEQADKYLKEGKTGKTEKQLIDCIVITKDNVDKLHTFVYTP